MTKIYAGTIVRSMSENGIGIIFNDTEINEILGVNDSDSSNTAVFIANGDRSSYYNNLYAVGHQKYNDAPIAWHAYASSNTSGQCRIQYLIVYWGGTE